MHCRTWHRAGNLVAVLGSFGVLRAVGVVGVMGVMGVMILAAGCDGSGGSVDVDSGAGDSRPAVVDRDIDGRITINEVMTANVLTTRDDSGAAAPWIELYNPTAQDVPLGGYTLTNDFGQPRMAILPAPLVLPAGGYMVLWCDSRPSLGASHIDIVLTQSGGNLALARPDGSFIDRLTYGAQAVDLAAAREPDGSSGWVIEWHASPGTANPAGAAAPAMPQSDSDPPEMIPSVGDATDRVLAFDRLPAQYELRIDDAGIASLRAQPAAWVPASLVYDGRVYGPIGVNLKGTASFMTIDAKPAFRIHIDHFVDGARFFGLEKFYLNNMSNDGSMMHERIAYWAIGQAGSVPASRANHALVTMNGQLLGLYSQVEEPRDQMMARFFPDATGPLYTIHYADFAAPYLAGFEPQDGPDDRTLINALTSALAMKPAATAITAAAPVVNLHEFARYWALMVILGHWGGWPYAATAQPVGANAGVYADPTTRQLYFVPEGIDDTFYTADYDFLGQLRSTLPLACQAVPSCFQDFANQVWEILDKLDQVDWAGAHDRIATQIAPFVPMDTRKSYSNDNVTMYQQQMRYFITGRRGYMNAALPPPSP